MILGEIGPECALARGGNVGRPWQAHAHEAGD